MLRNLIIIDGDGVHVPDILTEVSAVVHKKIGHVKNVNPATLSNPSKNIPGSAPKTNHLLHGLRPNFLKKNVIKICWRGFLFPVKYNTQTNNFLVGGLCIYTVSATSL